MNYYYKRPNSWLLAPTEIKQNGVKRYASLVFKIKQSISICLSFHGLEIMICSPCYENQVGFLHYSVAEDFLTGFALQSKGWKSVYVSSSKPQFLGSGVTNLNDLLTQGTRWSTGLVEVGISKFCPLAYGPSKMCFLEKMCYGNFTFFPFYCIPLWCFATIPQLCLLKGIPLYPGVKPKIPFFNLN